uniref:HTH cro/C1-type domain-containing protein n=1 Tax=Candidatus Kentrum sp. TC TaxID=2126339 RepID=A0A450YYH5_9GAMM|nr:MAG: hypothetical protein BECKTC1821E_GA0114239_10672 [Candidatus Kentron sp. TC]
MTNLPSRLRDERKRLGYNQTDFGNLGNVTRKTQMLYEKGEYVPNAHYLSAIEGAGADVSYILTGRRGGAPPTDEEARVLAQYRGSPPDVREGVRLILGETSRGDKPEGRGRR